MSNKAKSGAMKDKSQRELKPKLRFPEFQDAPEWKAETLGRICEFVRGPFGGALKKDIFVSDGYAVYEQCAGSTGNGNLPTV
jgi:type I restriction enzyme S subunit